MKFHTLGGFPLKIVFQKIKITWYSLHSNFFLLLLMQLDVRGFGQTLVGSAEDMVDQLAIVFAVSMSTDEVLFHLATSVDHDV